MVAAVALLLLLLLPLLAVGCGCGLVLVQLASRQTPPCWCACAWRRGEQAIPPTHRHATGHTLLHTDCCTLMACMVGLWEGCGLKQDFLCLAFACSHNHCARHAMPKPMPSS